MYLKATARSPCSPPRKKVVLAKAIELGEQMVEAPWKAISSSTSGTFHHTERKTRTTKQQHRLPYGEEAHALVSNRQRHDDGAADRSSQQPGLPPREGRS